MTPRARRHAQLVDLAGRGRTVAIPLADAAIFCGLLDALDATKWYDRLDHEVWVDLAAAAQRIYQATAVGFRSVEPELLAAIEQSSRRHDHAVEA